MMLLSILRRHAGRTVTLCLISLGLIVASTFTLSLVAQSRIFNPNIVFDFIAKPGTRWEPTLTDCTSFTNAGKLTILTGGVIDCSDDVGGGGGGITSLNGLTAATQTFVNDTNITMVSSVSTHTITWAGLLAAGRGGTGAGAFTQGSVVFAGPSGVYTQDNANFCWHDVNNRLGIGTCAPDNKLSILGTPNALADLAVEQNYHLKIQNINDINGQGVGISFGMSSTDDQQTAAIVARRTGSNGQGALQFYTKQSTSSGIAPVLSLALDENGNAGIGVESPATSALLELFSTTGALLPTRMTTTQRDALTAVDGMVLYNSTLAQLQGRVAAAWVDLGASGGGGTAMLAAEDDFFVGVVINPAGISAQPPPSNQLACGAVNRLCTQKFYLPTDGNVINHISFEVVTAGVAGGDASIGLYNSARTLVLSTGRLCDTSTPELDTTGAKVVSASSTDCGTANFGFGNTFDSGFYWLAMTADETTVQVTSLNATQLEPTLNANAVIMGFANSGSTNGVLPSTLPSLTASGQTASVTRLAFTLFSR